MANTYPEDLDVVWLAVDVHDHVAAFVTGGVGPIPDALVREAGGSIGDEEGRICDLPPTSEWRLLVDVPRPDDFVALATRGLYVYDWRDVHRARLAELSCYELVAYPLRPTSAFDLKAALKHALPMADLRPAEFRETKVLDVRKYVKCIGPDTGLE